MIITVTRYFFIFTPTWGNDKKMTNDFQFSKGLVQPPTSLPFLCREPGTGPPALAEYLGINVRQDLFIDIFGAFITVQL